MECRAEDAVHNGQSFMKLHNNENCGKPAPLPYPIAHMGHTHVVHPPH